MTSAPDPAELLRDIANGIDDGLLAPIEIVSLPGYPDVTLRGPDNDLDALKRWADWFRLDAPTANGEPFPALGRRPAWRSHESRGAWHEWQIRLWASIDV